MIAGRARARPLLEKARFGARLLSAPLLAKACVILYFSRVCRSGGWWPPTDPPPPLQADPPDVAARLQTETRAHVQIEKHDRETA